MITALTFSARMRGHVEEKKKQQQKKHEQLHIFAKVPFPFYFGKSGLQFAA